MTLINELKKMVDAKDLLLSPLEKNYARLDQSTNVKECLPLLVVRVRSREALISVAKQCLAFNVPVVMRGAGTGKSGGAVGDKASVVIDISCLNRILSIDSDNLLAEVEPGVILADFKREVSKKNLFYPPDPASESLCTLGGNVAENAAGPSTVKYGTTRDYLLGGEAIIGTGELINFGKRCPKGVAGYDISSLLCGSEGSLAIFTKLILRLLPKPKSQAVAMYFFTDQFAALLSVSAVFNEGHLPKTLEYVDHDCLMALKKLVALDGITKTGAALIIECDACYKGGALKQINALTDTLTKHAPVDVVVAHTGEERKDLWRKRSLLSEACTQFLGYKLSEDVAVPLGMLGQFLEAIKGYSHAPNLICAAFGHAGDGNLHVQIMFDHERFRDLAQAIRHEIILLVIRLGGTIAAEHGIGLQKKAYLPLEQSPALINLQRRIKYAFDPHNLLNPGKIFDVNEA